MRAPTYEQFSKSLGTKPHLMVAKLGQGTATDREAKINRLRPFRHIGFGSFAGPPFQTPSEAAKRPSERAFFHVGRCLVVWRAGHKTLLRYSWTVEVRAAPKNISSWSAAAWLATPGLFDFLKTRMASAASLVRHQRLDAALLRARPPGRPSGTML